MALQNAFFLVAILLIAATPIKVTHDQCTCANCCPNGMILETVTLRCICPSATPYLDAAGRCITCASPKSWNAITR